MPANLLLMARRCHVPLTLQLVDNREGKKGRERKGERHCETGIDWMHLCSCAGKLQIVLSAPASMFNLRDNQCERKKREGEGKSIKLDATKAANSRAQDFI